MIAREDSSCSRRRARRKTCVSPHPSDLSSPCASASPPGTSIRSGCGSISSSRFVKAEQPDVLCLQEIKCVEDKFPELQLRALGFPHIAVSGQKGYHGVATLSRTPFRQDRAPRHLRARACAASLGEARRQRPGKPARAAQCLCAGRRRHSRSRRSTRSSATSSISSRRWTPGSAGCADKRKNRMILVGDLNVAPLPTDVWSHKQLLESGEPHAGGGRAASLACRPRTISST